ncbi:flagellar assembly peptidoglycan hydrolase FlgJ [Pseudoxanthomonas composti]|uniref:Peptidoglycan hydrolase FlgJ n=1 Tax=Pseudoxanthomonas composti TaxID=2137479 RepID=A0A4Q1JSJ4_9GAMM|nr:flagellar assembly peptidoglycan hydrolase FlgJ [Pseudoxanthomonas composti]RXR02675.1 flagellar assembly peptidoglycan hydrolase FlgJ [Pseudoxanthomonas composti]
MILHSPALSLSSSAQSTPAQIDKAAKQLEGQFAQMLIKSMRDASFGDSLFPGENQTFRDMHDQKLATAMTQGKGLGLAPIIARQLTQMQGGASDASKGGDVTRLDGAGSEKKAGLSLGAIGGAVSQAVSGAIGGAAAAVGGLPLQAAERAFDLIAGRMDAGAAEHKQADALGSQLQPQLDPAEGIDWSASAPSVDDAAQIGNAAQTASSFAPRSPEHFVAKIWDHAQAAARELGVDAKALVAQAALETGWGRRMIGSSAGNANNLFGIKATGWSGKSATVATTEYYNGVKTTEQAAFRAYDSPAESFADYVRMIKNNPRYQQALQSGGDVRKFASALQRAGYATDPNYASKISAIANGKTLGDALGAISQVAARAVDGAGAAAGTAFASVQSTASRLLR